MVRGVASEGELATFCPLRKRPNVLNRSKVPMSTHIGYTHCCVLWLFDDFKKLFKQFVVSQKIDEALNYF